MFELYKSASTRKFHYRLKAVNGQIILSGQGYKSKASCQAGIRAVKANVARKDAIHIKPSRDGRRYFTVVASNGEVIGQSQMYKSTSGLHNGIASVQKNARGDTNDLT